MNKCLITGFSGFVARHFIEYLENSGNNCIIKGLDFHNPDFRFDHYKNVKISFEKIDLLSSDQTKYIIHEFQPNHILHLASYSSVAYSWKEPVQSFLNNTNIYLNVLEAVRKLNMGCRILSVGSSEEYGEVYAEDLPLKEYSRLNPTSPYAVARISQEFLSKVYADGYGMDIVLTRSFNHIGTGQKDIFVVSSFAKQIAEIKKSGRKKGVISTGDLQIVRDFLDVRDVVRAYYLLLTQGKKGWSYNVCSGNGHSLQEVVDELASIAGIEISTKLNPALVRPADNRIIIGSNKRICDDLGWQPDISFQQSLKDILKYWELAV